MADDYDKVFAQCRAMSVAEIKAELDMRGISYAGLFEKAELAKALAETRVEGRADPDILDRFNREQAERMMDADAPKPTLDDLPADAVAGDGGLPGGMSPEKLQALMTNPEMMALLSNPRMQEVMKQVMEKGPSGVDPATMQDPELRELMQKLQKVLGQ